jgi:hypothetical protein
MENVIAAIIGRMLDKWEQKKKNSFIGAGVIESLLEEAYARLDIIKKKQHKSLPDKNWKEIKKVPYEVMRIISKNKVMTQCKNYFEKTTKNYRDAIEYQFLNGKPKDIKERKELVENTQKIRDCKEETENIIKILEKTKLSLEKNYKK